MIEVQRAQALRALELDIRELLGMEISTEDLTHVLIDPRVREHAGPKGDVCALDLAREADFFISA
jgi:hypothetical protein